MENEYEVRIVKPERDTARTAGSTKVLTEVWILKHCASIRL